MGNGHPVAAVVTRAEIAERFASETDMFSTFGGNPVACRAALAVLDVIEEEELQRRALEVGEHLRAGLGEIEKTHDSIAEVRGAGLLVGVELVDPETRQPVPASARAVIGEMKDRGVLIGSTGRMGNVLKIRPPLVVTKSDADVIISTLGDCIAAV
jgi:4-aminobutyrate aminotransferase-like enzyme